jgi:hypothetical protein
MTYSVTGAASIAFSRLGMKTRLSGTVSVSVLTWDAFVGHDIYTSNVFELMKLCIELCCFRETNLVCNILFGTPMAVIRMLLVNCCNEWCVVLDHYDLGLLSKVVWNPSRFLDYRGYGSLCTRIWLLQWLFYTYILIIWSVLLQRCNIPAQGLIRLIGYSYQ